MNAPATRRYKSIRYETRNQSDGNAHKHCETFMSEIANARAAGLFRKPERTQLARVQERNSFHGYSSHSAYRTRSIAPVRSRLGPGKKGHPWTHAWTGHNSRSGDEQQAGDDRNRN